MRTKVLICAAALAMASAFNTMAQVYSLNIVGYINLPLQDGYNLVANQLDADGTGTNNTVLGVFSTNLPPNSVVWTFTGGNFNSSTFSKKTGAWTTPTLPVNPGEGFWVQIPTGTYGTGTGSVTTVGQVLQGSQVNPYVNANGGYSLLSVMAPVSGGLQTQLGYTPAPNDQVFSYVGGTYVISTFSAKTHAWTPSEPQVGVGQGFWLSSTNKSIVWSNYFSF